MAKREILFLSPRTGDVSRLRERNHEPSIAKSHAARVSQNRSKKKTHKKKPTSSRISIPVQGDQVLELSLVTKSLSTLPSLRTGNSDPFASYAVEVTPRVNELIHFFSSFYSSAAFQRHLTRTAFRSDFIRKTIAGILQNQSSAQAFLSSFMTLRSCLSPENLDFQREKVRLNKEASLALQANMKKKGLESSEVFMALKFCFVAAAFDGNIIEATMHGTMLKDLLSRKWRADHQSVDIHEFIHITYVDGQLAFKHLTRTILDMDWIDKVLEPAVAPTEELMEPILPMINADLDPAIDHPPLRSLFRRARVTRYLISRPMQDTRESRCAGIWLGAGSGTFQARVANYYYIVQRQLSRAELSAGDRFIWLTRGAMALALGIVVNTPESMALYKVQGPGGDRITARLREITTQIAIAASYLPQNMTSNYDRVHLWTYFICAQNEQRELQEQNAAPVYHHSPTAFFTRIFAVQACRMHLSQWDKVRRSIERVVYYDGLSPNGAYWVDDAINHYFNGETAASGLFPREHTSPLPIAVPRIVSPTETTFQLPSRSVSSDSSPKTGTPEG